MRAAATTKLLGLLILASSCGDDEPSADDGSSATGTTTAGSGSSTAVVEGTTSSAPSTGPDVDSGSTDVAADSTGGPTGYQDVYDLEGDELFPEGVAFDPVGEAFYVGSLGDGSIRKMTVAGEQTLHGEAPEGMWTSSGLKVDADAGRIWVCANSADMSAIWQFDLDSGDLQQSYDLEDIAMGAGCNDVALDAQGRVYVSDPPLGTVHRIEAGGAAEAWSTHPDFAMEVPGLGLNGLAMTPDEQYLIVAKFTPQRLFRIAMDDPDDVVTVDLSGDEFAGLVPISGCDGIVFSGDALYVTFAEVVKRVDFADDWSTGVVSTLEVPDVGNGLSTATVAAGAVYVVKSEVTAFVLGSAPALPFQIVRVPEG